MSTITAAPPETTTDVHEEPRGISIPHIIGLLVLPLALFPMAWLRSRGLLAPTALWWYPLIVFGTLPFNSVLFLQLEQHPDSRLLIHLRAACTTATLTALLAATGWGPALGVVYSMVLTGTLRVTGKAALIPSLLWSCVGIVVGEVLVEFGWAPSVMSTGASHVYAGSVLLSVIILVTMYLLTTRSAEQAQQAMRERGESFAVLLSHATDVIGMAQVTGEVISLSPACLTVLGVAPQAAKGRPLAEVIGCEPTDLPDLTMLQPNEAVSTELTVAAPDGSMRSFTLTLSRPNDDSDVVIVNLHDRTLQREVEDRLRHDAHHDHLTGLLNRTAFLEILQRESNRADQRSDAIALIFIDLDGFKAVNDELGHDHGDSVLIEVTTRLRRSIRRSEAIARLGGDEFVVMVELGSNPKGATILAERLVQALREPYEGAPDHRVSASLGIALRPAGGMAPSALLRTADEAMYLAKHMGKDRWVVSPETQTDSWTESVASATDEPADRSDLS